MPKIQLRDQSCSHVDDSPPTQIGTSHFPTILAAQGITKPYNQTFNSLSTSMRSINLLTSCVPCNQSTYIPPGQLAALRSIKAVTHKQFSECGCRLVFLCRKGFCGSVPMACRSLLYLQYLTLKQTAFSGSLFRPVPGLLITTYVCIPLQPPYILFIALLREDENNTVLNQWRRQEDQRDFATL